MHRHFNQALLFRKENIFALEQGPPAHSSSFWHFSSRLLCAKFYVSSSVVLCFVCLTAVYNCYPSATSTTTSSFLPGFVAPLNGLSAFHKVLLGSTIFISLSYCTFNFHSPTSPTKGNTIWHFTLTNDSFTLCTMLVAQAKTLCDCRNPLSWQHIPC